MMKLKALVVLASVTVVCALALALLPLSTASAWQNPTPTVPPLSDFVIPTGTPGGAAAPTATTSGFAIPTATTSGFAIPTATSSGGFAIPTSTPASVEPAGPGFPALSEDDLVAMNLQPGDVPAEFAVNQRVGTFRIQEVQDALNSNQALEDLATLLETLTNTYGWDTSVFVSYPTECETNVPIAKIYSEITPLRSAELGRQFIDDPQAKKFYEGLDYVLQPATTVHGWRAVLPAEDGACFYEEITYRVIFEYWGLLITVSLTADATTDPALVYSLIDQLVPVILARADAFAGAPFPPTPMPGAGPLVIPTQPSVSVTPTPTATLPSIVNSAVLDQVDALMPTLEEIGLPTGTFALNESLSGPFLPAQIVGLYQSSGMTELALASGDEMTRDGQIGTAIRVFDTGEACPDTVGLSVEIDVSVYTTAEGARASLDDLPLQQAWINSGIISSFTPTADGGLLASGSFEHRCGTVTYHNKMVVHGRFVVAASVISNEGVNAQDVTGALDVLNNYMVQKLQQAGLQ